MAATRTGRKQLSTGSPSKAQATRIEAMWNALAAEHRAWDLLEPVLDGASTIGALFDAWQETQHDIGEMRRRMADVDLAPLIDEYLRHYRGLGNHTSSAAKIEWHLRWLLPVSTTRLRTSVTPAWLTSRLAAYTGIARKGQKKLPPVATTTRRRVHSDWSGFFAYLAGPEVSTGALYTSNLMDAVTRPTPKPPPIRFYELREIALLLEQAPSREMRALWALLYATSIDISTAILLRRQDFDEAHREVRAPGTKAHSRDRICRVADWAWDIVVEFLQDKAIPDELWPGWNRWTATDAHKVAAKAAGLRPLLPLRCSRHAWAVRAAKAGTPIAIIAAARTRKPSARPHTLWSLHATGNGSRSMGEARS